MAQANGPEELLALQNFQKAVGDLKLDPGTLMRFLRARNLDLRQAEKMIRAYSSWTINNKFEPALKGWSPPREFMLQFECFHCGFDNEGRPVYYLPFEGWMPSRPLFDVFDSFDMMVFSYNSYLKVYKELLKTQHQQVVVILDNMGIGFGHIFREVQHWQGIQTLINVWELYEANYPETLHKAFFINTARAFMWGFNLMRPFIAKHTLSKISFFGTNEEDWGPALREHIPDDAIPTKFGGSANLNNVYDMIYDGVIKDIMSQTPELIQ